MAMMIMKMMAMLMVMMVLHYFISYYLPADCWQVGAVQGLQGGDSPG